MHLSMADPVAGARISAKSGGLNTAEGRPALIRFEQEDWIIVYDYAEGDVTGFWFWTQDLLTQGLESPESGVPCFAHTPWPPPDGL
jgi:hypothetical protein